VESQSTSQERFQERTEQRFGAAFVGHPWCTMTIETTSKR
jgi:hypothetical protein